MFSFEKCRLADARIISLTPSGDQLNVVYRDWREMTFVFKFIGVVGYQSFSPEDRDLSHGTIERDDPLSELACRAAREDCEDLPPVYSFVDAWENQKVLRVVANHVDHEACC